MNPLTEALDILHNNGWVKAGGGPRGERCIVTAFAATEWALSEPNNEEYTQAGDLIGQVIREQYPDRWDGMVAKFNDHKDTTFADVERVLEKAAIKWEEQQ